MCRFARAILSTAQGPTRPPADYDPWIRGAQLESVPLILGCRVCGQMHLRSVTPQAINPLLACANCSALYERHARNEPPPFLVHLAGLKGAHIA
jgi:hypothetical protein